MKRVRRNDRKSSLRRFGVPFVVTVASATAACGSDDSHASHVSMNPPPGMLARVRRNYGVADRADAAEVSISDADRAWGLMPIAEYREAVRETFVRDYAPRFSELGIVMV